MSRPCIAPGTEEQSRTVPAIPLEPYLDRAQRARECAAMSLGDLLLSTGAVEGPFKPTHPATRWTRAAQRFTRELLAFALWPLAVIAAVACASFLVWVAKR